MLVHVDTAHSTAQELHACPCYPVIITADLTSHAPCHAIYTIHLELSRIHTISIIHLELSTIHTPQGLSTHSFACAPSKPDGLCAQTCGCTVGSSCSACFSKPALQLDRAVLPARAQPWQTAQTAHQSCHHKLHVLSSTHRTHAPK